MMGDAWDYKLRKMEYAWNLANRIIPAEKASSGCWAEKDFLAHAQEILSEAQGVVDAVFDD